MRATLERYSGVCSELDKKIAEKLAALRSLRAFYNSIPST
jgi:hypothetical protein